MKRQTESWRGSAREGGREGQRGEMERHQGEMEMERERWRDRDNGERETGRGQDWKAEKQRLAETQRMKT